MGLLGFQRIFGASLPLAAHSRHVVFLLWGNEVAFQLSLTLGRSQHSASGSQPLQAPLSSGGGR